MKKLVICLLPVTALLFASSIAARADQFTQIQNSPNGYWVQAPTPPPPVAYYPPPGYAGPPPGYYAGSPPPYYYGPPGPYYYGPRPYYGPPLFFSFGFGGGGYHHHH